MDDIQILHTPTRRPEGAACEVNPTKVFFAKGHKLAEGRRAFATDTIWERDVAVPMRDGAIIRADVFRPATAEGGEPDCQYPALVAWSPYGKESGRDPDFFDHLPGRMGLPKSLLSGYQSFEAPDPAEWTAHGYAICNVDIRGIGNSEGNLQYWGSADGRDGYDAVEHIARLPWCNGSIALVGNSWLAMSQWFIAAEQPPHLKCIAPLEGAGDIYRETLGRGGVPAEPFHRFISGTMTGQGQQEDLIAMLRRYPTWNSYWEDKRAKMDRISVPAYILASFSTGLHTLGSFRAYEESQGPKWLRVHASQEWFDLYSEGCKAELKKFFDHYTKGIENGWGDTPRTRLSIIRFNQHQTLYLDGTSRLSPGKAVDEGSYSYQSDAQALQADCDPEEIRFEYTFTETSYLVGYSKATLFVSCQEHDDMDVFVQLRKADAKGNLLQWLNVPAQALGMAPQDVPSITPLKYLGPTGILRASHRKLDGNLSKPYRPVPSHSAIEKVSPGTIVKLEIGIWPTAIAFEKGEKLVLKISGHNMMLAEFVPLRGSFTSGNQGRHHIHFGGENNSSIDVPFVQLM